MNYETLFDSETIAGDEFEFDELESDGEAIDPEFEDEVRRRRRGATPRRRTSTAVRRVSRQLSTGCSCKQTPPSEYVRWLQTALNEVLRQQLPVNGVISPATRNALRSFQQQQGLRVDGIAGPETKRALVSARAGGAQPAAEPEPPPAPESEFESAFEDEFETSATRKPIDLGEIVVCGGKPFAVLDNFTFNSASLRRDSTRNHAAQVAAIAAEIRARAARRKPVPSVCIVGHTDAAGSVAFNYGLGLQRARTVKDALCRAPRHAGRVHDFRRQQHGRNRSRPPRRLRRRQCR
jgi:outer membrane protein OmpA-like peptidoglycan-associated protein